MNTRTVCNVLILLVHSILVFLAHHASSLNFTQWTCDELTPNLCPNLHVSHQFVNIRGIDVHYWRYFTDDPSSKLPIVLIHGGPAFTHRYLLPLKQLACRGHDVIMYDQAGCGHSSIPASANLADYPWLFDPSYYSGVELPQLVRHLRLERYHVLGHSWGTIVAQLFAINHAHSTGLQALVLSGPLSDAQLYIRSQWDGEQGSLGSLPPFVRKRLTTLEERHQFDSPEYSAIADVMTAFFTCRTAPAPDCLADCFNNVNADIYVAMQGPSEFSLGGVLSDFNGTASLPNIGVPTLLTSGKYDTMRPPVVDAMERNIKDVERIEFAYSAHVSMIDEPEAMSDAVADFLSRVERNSDKRYIRTSRVVASAASAPRQPVSWLSNFVLICIGFALGRLWEMVKQGCKFH